MSMTVTEANAVNVLLRWVTGKDSCGKPVVQTREQAIEAAQVLARGANRRLYAGWRPEQVPDAWPETPR